MNGVGETFGRRSERLLAILEIRDYECKLNI